MMANMDVEPPARPADRWDPDEIDRVIDSLGLSPRQLIDVYRPGFRLFGPVLDSDVRRAFCVTNPC